MNNEMNKLLTFTAVEWTGNQRVFTNRGENGQELPPPERRTARILSWMAWTGEEEWDKGLGLFCPGWSHQPRPKTLHLSRSVAPTETKGPSDQQSLLKPPTETNVGPLVPVGGSNGTKDPCAPTLPSQPLDPGLKHSLVSGKKAVGTNGLNQRPVLQQCNPRHLSLNFQSEEVTLYFSLIYLPFVSNYKFSQNLSSLTQNKSNMTCK